MLTVHHLNNSRSQRVLWVLEELKIPYEIKYYERDSKTLMAPASLKEVHPLGKSPVVTDGDVTIAESGAIIEYLVDTYGQGSLKPTEGSKEYLRYKYWLHYAEGSAMMPLILTLVFSQIKKARVPFFVKGIIKTISQQVHSKFIDPQLKLHFDYMDFELAKNPWFAGSDFTAADIQMSYPIEAMELRGGLGDRNNLKKFVERIHTRPAYQKAIEKGGPYESMN